MQEKKEKIRLQEISTWLLMVSNCQNIISKKEGSKSFFLFFLIAISVCEVPLISFANRQV